MKNSQYEGTMIWKNVNDKKGRFLGTLIALRFDQKIRIGYSKKAKKDKINQELGDNIAYGRAVSSKMLLSIPQSLKLPVFDFALRVKRYFKDCMYSIESQLLLDSLYYESKNMFEDKKNERKSAILANRKHSVEIEQELDGLRKPSVLKFAESKKYVPAMSEDEIKEVKNELEQEMM